ncbi:MAG: hypothetical protein NXY57DRAFT_1038382 [Lentinula lateritia]|uniref:Uncharacterized protein n=1 Tax=Lentinula lateritia TaxID=40482 RepID=A0ABQ8VP57_9AGAR|nr:MAG: hypothetical protein NXY57DRAFT_1038382 [Lentinula lateritia]KAJ4497367.1 hypothetical protein C8R41DRAFT_894586 [Lentinula lateritia]
MNLNPYAQAGWGGSSGGSGPAPSIFGALPFSSQATGPSIHEFRFTAFNPDILDCTVLGPSSNTYFRVLNNTPSQNFTLFQNREGKSIAVLEWRGSSGVVVEVRDVIRKQFVASWLQLSTDGKYRFMYAHDRTFVWVPQDGYVGLYTYGTTTPELYARLSRTDGGVTLEITSTAIRESLLECCVVATVLLQSGRSID